MDGYYYLARAWHKERNTCLGPSPHKHLLRGLVKSLSEVKEPMESELPPGETGFVMAKPVRTGSEQLRELNEKKCG